MCRYNNPVSEPLLPGQGQEADKCGRVGREEEGTSTNSPELGEVVLVLQSVALSEDVLLLCDNEAVLCDVKKWVGQGGKATLATAPDVDTLSKSGSFRTASKTSRNGARNALTI